MSIDEILKPTDVNLALRAADKQGAVIEVLGQLHGDARVTDWAELKKTVIERDAPAMAENGLGICIAHGRTGSVKELVMAAGRSELGVVCANIEQPVRLIFVAGIPSAFSSEYLRIVGAIARVCRDPEQFERLLTAPDGEAFVESLTEASEKL